MLVVRSIPANIVWPSIWLTFTGSRPSLRIQTA